MATVKCPNPICLSHRTGETVPFGRFCCYCNTEFVMEADRFAGWDAYVFFDAAHAMAKNMRDTCLVRIQALKVPGDGSLPYLKEIHVEHGMRLFLYSSAQPRPVQLAPGIYSTEDIFNRHGLATSIQPFEDQSWCCFCWVPTQPISVVVALPDFLLLKDALTYDGQDMRVLMDMIANSLRKLGLVDRDNQMGGASLQLDFRCNDPARLMETVAQEFIENEREGLETRGAQNPDRIIKARKVPAKVEPPPPWWTITGLLRSVKQGLMKVVGVQEKERLVSGPPSELLRFEYTMGDLYRGINMQFRSAIQDALRNMSVSEFFENRRTVGRQMEEEIKKAIARRLQNYGFEIAEVSAFEFICPGYMRMREKETKIREAKQALKLQEETAKINQEAADLAQQELNTAAVRDAKTQTERLNRQAGIGAEQDAHAKAAMVRAHEAQGIENKFKRVEKTADAQVTLEIESARQTQEMALEFQHEKGKADLLKLKMDMAADLQLKIEKEQHAQLKEFVDQIKGLPPAVQLNMLVARNPELANALMAAHNVAAKDEIIRLQERRTADWAHLFGQLTNMVGQALGNPNIRPPIGEQEQQQLSGNSNNQNDSGTVITPREEQQS